MIDLCLVMSVNPGWGGQSYIPASTERLAALCAGCCRPRSCWRSTAASRSRRSTTPAPPAPTSSSPARASSARPTPRPPSRRSRRGSSREKAALERGSLTDVCSSAVLNVLGSGGTRRAACERCMSAADIASTLGVESRFSDQTCIESSRDRGSESSSSGTTRRSTVLPRGEGQGGGGYGSDVEHTYGGFPLRVALRDRSAGAGSDHDWGLPVELAVLETRSHQRPRVDIGAHLGLVEMILARSRGRRPSDRG